MMLLVLCPSHQRIERPSGETTKLSSEPGPALGFRTSVWRGKPAAPAPRGTTARFPSGDHAPPRRSLSPNCRSLPGPRREDSPQSAQRGLTAASYIPDSKFQTRNPCAPQKSSGIEYKRHLVFFSPCLCVSVVNVFSAIPTNSPPKFACQPCLGKLPVAHHGLRRNFQHLRSTSSVGKWPDAIEDKRGAVSFCAALEEKQILRFAQSL